MNLSTSMDRATRRRMELVSEIEELEKRQRQVEEDYVKEDESIELEEDDMSSLTNDDLQHERKQKLHDACFARFSALIDEVTAQLKVKEKIAVS